MIIDKFTLFSFISIREKLLLPLDKFLSNDEILEVCDHSKYNNKFFSLPFFLHANENDLREIKGDKINLFYEKKFYGSVGIKSVSLLNKNLMIEKLFSKKNKYSKHPYKDYLLNCGNYVIETFPFIKDKKKIIKKKLIGFATRNIPHKGHEKIIKYFSSKKNHKLIVNIFENSTKNKKINSDQSFKSYKKFIKRNNLNKKVILKKIKLPSFLLGPKQAAIHAIVGKNLSCNSYIIGRDHSGYKGFYGEHDSLNYCKEKQKKIGLKIFDSGSPVYCKKKMSITFRKDCICGDFIDISASLLRSTKNKNLKKILSNFHEK